jgi:hypothetical protein
MRHKRLGVGSGSAYDALPGLARAGSSDAHSRLDPPRDRPPAPARAPGSGRAPPARTSHASRRLAATAILAVTSAGRRRQSATDEFYGFSPSLLKSRDGEGLTMELNEELDSTCEPPVTQKRTALNSCPNMETGVTTNSRPRRLRSMSMNSMIATARSIARLRAELNGRVVAPDEAGYEWGRAVSYRSIERRPAVIVRPSDASKISRVVSLPVHPGRLLRPPCLDPSGRLADSGRLFDHRQPASCGSEDACSLRPLLGAGPGKTRGKARAGPRCEVTLRAGTIRARVMRQSIPGHLFDAPVTAAGRRKPQYELASRRSGGILVRLFWRPRGNDVFVRVTDELTGENFVLEPPNDSALSAFYHPYAQRQPEGRSAPPIDGAGELR